MNPNAIVSGGIAVGFAVAASGQVLGMPFWVKKLLFPFSLLFQIKRKRVRASI